MKAVLKRLAKAGVEFLLRSREAYYALMDSHAWEN